MFTLEKDDRKIGIYLRQTILKKYDSIRRFCRAYLELRDGSTNDEEIRKLLNRFSQILKGVKRIQVDDLPYVTELLEVSCEEILSAGKVHLPISSHMTNYDIAFSHDREVWERYMKREDKLFLNCDEYCKSVIDYALEFKNYDFIKYLINEKFIWFVDMSEWKHFGFTYGAGTSVKRREIGYIDTHTPLELQYQDELRIKTIALAIENEDFDVLDSLLAREIPEMHQANMVGYPAIDLQSRKNIDLIRAIALSNDQIIDYYSQEFIVKNQQKKDNMGCSALQIGSANTRRFQECGGNSRPYRSSCRAGTVPHGSPALQRIQGNMRRRTHRSTDCPHQTKCGRDGTRHIGCQAPPAPADHCIFSVSDLPFLSVRHRAGWIPAVHF